MVTSVSGPDGGEDILTVERHGGMAGFGTGGALKSEGTCLLSRLPPEERETVERLLARGGVVAPAQPGADIPYYRISRDRGGRLETVDVHEALAPETIRGCVRDMLK